MTTTTAMPLPALPRPLALVLSGGASLGALQVGQLRALAELRAEPDLVVGTSVGAINALFAAQGLHPERMQRLAEIWRGLRTGDVFAGVGLGSLLRALRGTGSVASARRLDQLMRRHLPDSFAALPVAAHLVATDLLSGGPVLLSRGDPRRAALASSAIPGVFPAIEIDGRALIDGGVVANVPVVPAARLGARSMIVLDAGFPCALAAPPHGLLASALHAMATALRSQIRFALPQVASGRAILYLPAPCPLAVAHHDFSRSGELIEEGYRGAVRFLRSLVWRGPDLYGGPHDHARLDVQGRQLQHTPSAESLHRTQRRLPASASMASSSASSTAGASAE